MKYIISLFFWWLAGTVSHSPDHDGIKEIPSIWQFVIFDAVSRISLRAMRSIVVCNYIQAKPWSVIYEANIVNWQEYVCVTIGYTHAFDLIFPPVTSQISLIFIT